MSDENEPTFDVEWQMDWGENRDLSRHPERYQMMFEEEAALAELLHNEVCFLNSYWFRKDLSDDDRSRISVLVNCSDVFAWGCADAEPLPYKEIENLWRMWAKDKNWGAAIWAMTQRRQMPQKPVEDSIRKSGLWDLDSLNLETNTMNDWVKAQIALYVQSGRDSGV